MDVEKRPVGRPPLTQKGPLEPGKVYFISPDDKIYIEGPRTSWHIDLILLYIDGVLHHLHAELQKEEVK